MIETSFLRVTQRSSEQQNFKEEDSTDLDFLRSSFAVYNMNQPLKSLEIKPMHLAGQSRHCSIIDLLSLTRHSLNRDLVAAPPRHFISSSRSFRSHCRPNGNL